MYTLNKEAQKLITPEKATDLLKEGNKRFVSNLKFNRNLLQQVNETSDGQHPFAVIISCMDSRTSAELVFDQGLGDIFSVRIAGNVINTDIVASAEFGCKAMGAKAIVVLGHTGCGAIKGSIEYVNLGHITSITRKVQRSIPVLKERFPKMSPGDLCHELTKENTHQGVRDLLFMSPILRDMVEKNEIKILSAMYDIKTGEVEFLESK